jgi:hypothetical protein
MIALLLASLLLAGIIELILISLHVPVAYCFGPVVVRRQIALECSNIELVVGASRVQDGLEIRCISERLAVFHYWQQVGLLTVVTPFVVKHTLEVDGGRAKIVGRLPMTVILIPLIGLILMAVLLSDSGAISVSGGSGGSAVDAMLLFGVVCFVTTASVLLELRRSRRAIELVQHGDVIMRIVKVIGWG